MKTNLWKPAATVCTILIVTLLAYTSYSKRSLQHHVRRFSVADDIGEQHSTGSVSHQLAKGAAVGSSQPTTASYSTAEKKTAARIDAGRHTPPMRIAKADAAPHSGGYQYEPYYAESAYRPTPTESAPAAPTVAYQTASPGMPSNGTTMLRKSQLALVRATAPDQVSIQNSDADGYDRASFSRSSLEQTQDRPFDELRYAPPQPPAYPTSDTEEYARFEQNNFTAVSDEPLSTFSADVDTASYSNIRRFLSQRQLPPPEAVRIEEMINYFTYDYPQPWPGQPFSITTDLAVCPWNHGHQLLRVGLKGKTPAGVALPPSNLVFLIDVSGSMADADKLPLLKDGFKMMARQLRPEDRVSILAYSSYVATVLSPTSGAAKDVIMNAIDNLEANGSTSGAEGLSRAYDAAWRSFIRGGNNRVILATDGDFNVGVTETSDLIRMIEARRQSGVFLTVLGFGQGNLKDEKLMQLADKGNGNYFYIDSFDEARKVMASELGSTMFAIAKDVKFQVEFNPAAVKAYRLVGYEKRALAKEDFNDDAKDAGEVGAGHTVTALYEIVPTGSWTTDGAFNKVDRLRYQRPEQPSLTWAAHSEALTVKIRYKEPNSDESKLIAKTVRKTDARVEPTGDFAWASAVAEFGMLLSRSPFSAGASYDHVLRTAQMSQGKDSDGQRAEFMSLVETARSLSPQQYWRNNPEPVYDSGNPGQPAGRIKFK